MKTLIIVLGLLAGFTATAQRDTAHKFDVVKVDYNADMSMTHLRLEVNNDNLRPMFFWVKGDVKVPTGPKSLQTFWVVVGTRRQLYFVRNGVEHRLIPIKPEVR